MKKYGIIILCVIFLLPNVVLGNDLERIKRAIADKIIYEVSYESPSQVRGVVYETVRAALGTFFTTSKKSESFVTEILKDMGEE